MLASFSLFEQITFIAYPLLVVLAVLILIAAIHASSASLKLDTAIGLGALLAIVLAGIALTVFPARSHHLQREHVTTALSKNYPDVKFTRVGVVARYVEFQTESAKCNANITKITGVFVIKHGTVSCYKLGTVDAVLTDSNQADLSKEMQTSLDYNNTNKNLPWYANSDH